MSQIEIIEKTENKLVLEIEPAVFDDTDADENYRVEINFDDDEFYCEHDDCENPDEPTGPSVSFLDWAPAQSLMSQCLSHQPKALIDFVNENR